MVRERGGVKIYLFFTELQEIAQDAMVDTFFVNFLIHDEISALIIELGSATILHHVFGTIVLSYISLIELYNSLKYMTYYSGANS